MIVLSDETSVKCATGLRKETAMTVPQGEHPKAEEEPPVAPPPRDGLGPPPLPLKPPVDDYDQIADTIGMVPSRNRADRVFQAAFILIGMGVCTVASMVTGYVLAGREGLGAGLALGLVGGLILSTLVSGVILMVRGWRRAVRRRRRGSG